MAPLGALTRDPRLRAAAPALAAALLYLSVPAARYNFDGVACAIAVELGDFKHLAHGNHLAYGLLGWLWFESWRLLGYAGPALQALQVMSALLGAAGIGAFAWMARRAGFSPGLAAAGAAGLAVSDLYWRWSLEAQVYPLGSAFLFFAGAEALRKPARPMVLALLQAGAVLGHAGHIVFLPAAWLALPGRKERLRHAAVLAAAVAAAYALVGLFIMRPGSLEELRLWLLGSAALDVDRKFRWHGGWSLAGFGDWLRVSSTMFGGGWPVGLAAFGAAGWGAWKERKSRTVRLCLLWLAAYGALYTAWEPATPVYRTTDFAPLWLLILAAASAPRLPWKAAVAAVAAAVLGLVNLLGSALPGGDPSRNAGLQRALWVARETPEDAWIASESVEQVYIPYFARRRPLNLRYFLGREEALARRIGELSRSGEPVYVVPESLARWRGWFESRPRVLAAQRGGEALYRLRRP